MLLEHAKQLDLKFGRGGVDFVEEDGAGMSGLEAAGAVVHGPREGPADVAEQLAFQQVLVQGPAVHANERPAAPRTEAVDGLGDQFLAGPRLAQQQHRGVRLGHLPHEPIAILHDGTGPPIRPGIGGPWSPCELDDGIRVMGKTIAKRRGRFGKLI